MTGYRDDSTAYRPAFAHRITVGDDGSVLRDGYSVKVVRVSNTEIRVGCTVVEIAALKRLLGMVESPEILQAGLE